MNGNSGAVVKRDNYLDFVRGLAIVFVLWGHVIQYFIVGYGDFYADKTYKMIYSFHMPLFMFISGYVFYWSTSKRDAILLIKKRIFTLGRTMVLWGMVCWIISRGNLLLRDPLTAILNLRTDIFSLWFLWSVLVSSIFVIVLNRLHGITAIIWLIVSIMLLYIIPNPDLNLFVYPFFILGFFSNKYKISQSLSKFGIVFLVFFLFLLNFYSKDHFVYITGSRLFGNTIDMSEQLKIILFRYMIALCGCAAVLYISYLIYKKNEKSKGVYYLSVLGKYSLQIYISQHFLLEHIGGKVYKMFVQITQHNYLAENRFLFDWIWSPMIAIVMCILITYGCKFIEKRTCLSRILFAR